MHFLYLFIAILAEVAATSFLKLSESFTKLIPSLLVVSGYTIAFYCLSLTLKTMSVGVAYAVWCGAGIVLVALVDIFFYKQSFDYPALLGMGLILIGVIMINVFSKNILH
jgi:small multidrug resistance pump